MSKVCEKKGILFAKLNQEKKSNDALLTPGQRIRPPIIIEMAMVFTKKLYGMTVRSIVELNAYDDRNYRIECEEKHENPYISSIDKNGYVLKVVNSLDSRKTEVLDAQTQLLIFLNERGIRCPMPVKNLNGTYYSMENLNEADPSEKYAVRMLVYRPGELLHRIPMNAELLRKVGRFTAELDETLANFHHSGYEGHQTLWMLTSVPKLRRFTYAVKDQGDRELTHDVIAAFEKEVLELTSELEHGIIHGDLNEQNIVMGPGGQDIEAVIDFGDSQRTALLFELAISLCYMLLQAGDVDMGKHFILGYETIRKIPEIEKKVLKVCVCARICQSLVMGAYSHTHDPQNEYLLSTQKSGWSLLKKLWPMSQRDVAIAWGLIKDTVV